MPEPMKAPYTDLAASQHGLVSRRQLLALKMTKHAIDWARERGALMPVRRGVYAVAGSGGVTCDPACIALVLAVGVSAAMSHHSAAMLLELGVNAGPDTICVPRKQNPLLPGVTIYRPRCFPPEHTMVLRGVP